MLAHMSQPVFINKQRIRGRLVVAFVLLIPLIASFGNMPLASAIKRVPAGSGAAQTNPTPTSSPTSTSCSTSTTYTDPAVCAAACQANPTNQGCPTTSSGACGSSSCDLVTQYINPAIDILTIIFGLIAAISLIVGAIQYSASAGDPQKASAAKHRISNTIIAFFAYAFLYSFLEFLIPGGIFK